MDTHKGIRTAMQAGFGLGTLVGFYIISRYNYLLFHGIVELFSIAVAWSVFLLVWNTRRISSNDAVLFLGIAYFFVGCIDLIHTLTYKGMGIFADDLAANHATQLWIAARGVEVVSLLLFSLLCGRRRVRAWAVWWGYAGVTGLLLAAILAWGLFPDCYIEGAGLTGFKVGAEYLICLVLALTIALLFKRRQFLDASVHRLMVAAMSVTIATELAFTIYTDVYGLSNFIGHLLKAISFFLVYLALVHSTLTRPQITIYQGLARDRRKLAEEGRFLRTIHKVKALFLESDTLNDVMGVLPDLVADYYALPIVAIELYDAVRQEMVFAGATGIPRAEGGQMRVPVDQTISGGVATSGRAVVDLNVSEHADYRAEALRELSVVTFACLPLIGQGGVIGTLAIADRKERPDILGDMNLLHALADSLTQEVERYWQEERLQESEEKYRYLYETMTQGVVIQDTEGKIIEANRAAGDILGLTRDQLFGRTAYDPRWKLIHEDGSPYHPAEMPSNIALRTGKTIKNVTCGIYVPEKNEYRWIIIGSTPQFRGSETEPSLTMTVFTNITERKRVELERTYTLWMLEILNARTGLRETMQSLIKLMQEMAGCEAAGIRLRDGDDFPYYETRGFPDDFVEAERHLCTQDLDGQLLRDEVGNPVLECMCGNIICGRFDPALPFFTEFGSFVSNGTSKLLASTTEEDRQARTRNRCNAEGYESVLLVPLRTGDETFGLLQFNDRREDCFSDGFVARIERLSGSIAIALAQRMVQEELRKSEENFRIIFENKGTATGIVGDDGIIRECNAVFAKLSGYPRSDLVGKMKLSDFVVKEDLERLQQYFKQRFENGGAAPTQYECNIVDRKGETRTVIVNLSMQEKDRIITLLDITERMQSEHALKKSEERFRLLAENIPGVIYLCKNDKRRSIIYISYKVEQLTGCSHEIIKNNEISFADLYHPDDVEQIYKKVEQALNAKEAFHLIYRIKYQNEKWIWIEEFGIGIYENDKAVSIEGVLFDITERKLAEEALRQTSERLQKVFDSQLDAIFVLDAEVPPRIVSFNTSASSIFGYEPEEMQGATSKGLHVDETHLKSFQDTLAIAVRDKGCLMNFEFAMKRKDGSVFPSGHTVMELTDGCGARTGWISIVSDLTERKMMEARLQQAQKMESIGTLAGGIAHDFNNILFPIIGMSELLMEDLPQDSIEYQNSEEILKAGKRGRDLVNQILAFSRQTEHRPIPIRPQQILKEVVKLIRSTIPSNIKISPWLQKDCGPVMADPTQLHQIAMNLLTNAYHAVEFTDGSISIRLKETVIRAGDLPERPLMSGRYALLTVSDTGPGIDPEHINKIFDPYFTTKEQGKGTGLGLAVVYGIIKEHGGDITVETEIGKGTTFSVYLPLIATYEEPAPSAALEILATGNERILLVDDESAVLALEKQMLERLGYHVTDLSSSSEALRLFSADPFASDLVVMDMAMPDITGDKLARQLIDIRPDIPIIICTGYSERIDREKAAAMGVKGLLMKPIIRSEMAQTIRKALDDARMERGQGK